MSLAQLMAQLTGRSGATRPIEVVNPANPATAGQQVPPQQQTVQGMPGNPPAIGQTSMMANAQNNPAPAPAPDFTKLDDFAQIFEAKPANPNMQPPAAKKLFPDFNAPAMRDEIGKLNFASMIPQEAYAKMMQGDTTMFSESLNKLMQQQMLYTFSGMSKLSEDAITGHGKSLAADLPNMMNAQRVQASLEQHPILSNPAIAPLRQALTAKFATDYPTASEAQINEFANKYLISIAGAVNQANAPAPAQQGRQTDWAAFANEI